MIISIKLQSIQRASPCCLCPGLLGFIFRLSSRAASLYQRNIKPTARYHTCQAYLQGLWDCLEIFTNSVRQLPFTDEIPGVWCRFYLFNIPNKHSAASLLMRAGRKWHTACICISVCIEPWHKHLLCMLDLSSTSSCLEALRPLRLRHEFET